MTDEQTRATYAWALLNGACDAETQAEFDNMALVPMEGKKVDHSRPDRALTSK